MKRVIFCVVALWVGLVCHNAVAQTAPDFKVQVVSGDQPVGYAYVLINNSYHAMTDPEGRTTIPAARLHRGDVVSAHFVGMESVPLTWDATQSAGTTITLQLTPNAIDAVVVTATTRDRSKQLFRRYVERLPTHEWYTGFRGDYDLRLSGDGRWRAFGTFERNHLPGDDVNSLGANTFTLTPDAASNPVPTWQVQRYILQVRGIAERAVQLGSSEKSNRDMIIRYRGTVDGRNVFLVIKPYFDRVQGTDDSFQTLLHVSAVSGVVFSSQTISRTKWGIWNVSATYAVNNGDGLVRGDEFIYPVTMKGNYQEKTPTSDNILTLDATINNTEVYRITPPPPPKSKIPY